MSKTVNTAIKRIRKSIWLGLILLLVFACQKQKSTPITTPPSSFAKGAAISWVSEMEE
ncbi:MAG: hypothetical protein SGJ00_10625 [bacterium]|nr:hypothetical protein [bacterium]